MRCRKVGKVTPLNYPFLVMMYVKIMGALQVLFKCRDVTLELVHNCYKFYRQTNDVVE
jgi:hypothetical protein